MSKNLGHILTLITIALLAFFLSSYARAQGLGTWRLPDGTELQVPCPAADAQADLTSIVRLPAKCTITYPRVGYTLEQDTKIRTEVTSLREQVPMLRSEIDASRQGGRATADVLRAQLDTCRKQEEDARHRRQDAELATRLQQAEVETLSRDRWLYGLAGVGVGVLVGLGTVALLGLQQH